MMQGSVIESVAAAFHAAILRDLPEIPARAYTLGRKERSIPERRPTHYDVEVWSFPEQWGSTSLGYGGMGGNVMTEAQTTIVGCRVTDSAAVYWGDGGRLGRIMSYSQGRECASNQRTERLTPS